MTKPNLQKEPIEFKKIDGEWVCTTGGKPLIPPETISEMINVKPQTLAIWRMKGIHLNYIKVGRRVMYALDDVNDFLSRNRKVIAA